MSDEPERRDKKRLEFTIIEKIPKLGGTVYFSNSHIFYETISEYVETLDCNIQLNLNNRGIVGDTSWVASVVNIHNELKAKNGSLWFSEVGNNLMSMLRLYKLKCYL